MKAFERSIKLFAGLASQARRETVKPKKGTLGFGPERRLSTTALGQFPDKPSHTDKPDEESNVEKGSKNSLSQEISKKDSSNANGPKSRPESLTEQAIRALERLEQQQGEPTISPRLTEGIAHFLTDLQKRYPSFEGSVQHLLMETYPSSTSGPPETKRQEPQEINLDIGDLETKETEKEHKPNLQLYDHFTNKGRRIKAHYWAAAVAPGLRPFSSKEAEENWLEAEGLKGKVDIIKYAKECGGQHFNCHGYTFTNGEGGCIENTDVKKILNDDCKLIGTSDTLNEPVEKDDIVIFQQGNEILHSAFVSEVKDGKIASIEDTWGLAGIYKHKPTDVLSIYGSHYQIYRRKGGRLIRKDSKPSYTHRGAEDHISFNL